MVVDTGDLVTGAGATMEGVGDTGKVKIWLPRWLQELSGYLQFILLVVRSIRSVIGTTTTAIQDSDPVTPSSKESTQV